MDGPDLDRIRLVPGGGDTPEKRLRYYASQFCLAEVDATYYALPAEQTAAAWATRTPPGFTFNVKAFSLFTPHPARVAALPADLRPAAQKAGKDRVYLKDVDPELADQAWQRFLAALEPLHQAGKLGAVLLQFPPWFPISRANKDYLLASAQRIAPRRVCVEFRNPTWMTPGNQQETLDFLSAHQLAYVCVDMPQGDRDSIPPVLAATTDLAVVRMHGQSARWDSKDIQERFGYRYTDQELRHWAPKSPPWPRTRGSPTWRSTTATATTPRPTPSNSPACRGQQTARERGDLRGHFLPRQPAEPNLRRVRRTAHLPPVSPPAHPRQVNSSTHRSTHRARRRPRSGRPETGLASPPRE